MQILPDRDLQLAAVERTVTGLSTPRSTAATAAPVAPVPDDIVSPTPRSKMRARIAAVAGRAARTTRSCGAGTARGARSAAP